MHFKPTPKIILLLNSHFQDCSQSSAVLSIFPYTTMAFKSQSVTSQMVTSHDLVLFFTDTNLFHKRGSPFQVFSITVEPLL